MCNRGDNLYLHFSLKIHHSFFCQKLIHQLNYISFILIFFYFQIFKNLIHQNSTEIIISKISLLPQFLYPIITFIKSTTWIIKITNLKIHSPNSLNCYALKCRLLKCNKLITYDFQLNLSCIVH